MYLKLENHPYIKKLMWKEVKHLSVDYSKKIYDYYIIIINIKHRF